MDIADSYRNIEINKQLIEIDIRAFCYAMLIGLYFIGFWNSNKSQMQVYNVQRQILIVAFIGSKMNSWLSSPIIDIALYIRCNMVRLWSRLIYSKPI